MSNTEVSKKARRLRFNPVKQDSLLKRVRRAHNKQPLLVRVLLFAFFSSAYIAVGIVYAPVSIASVFISLAVLATLFYAVIATPYLLKLALSVAFGMMLTTMLGLNASVFAPPEEHAWALVLWVSLHGVIIGLSLLWQSLHPRGLMWVNTLLLSLVMGVSAYGLHAGFGSAAITVPISGLAGVVFIAVRSLTGTKKSRQEVIKSEPLDADRLIAAPLNEAGFVARRVMAKQTKKRPALDLVVAISPFSHLVVIGSAKFEHPLTFDKKGRVFYEGVTMSGFFAEQMLKAKSLLPSGIPFVFAIAIDGDSTINKRKVAALAIRSRNKSSSQTILLVSTKGVGSTVSEAIRNNNCVPLTKKQLSKVTEEIRKISS